MICYIRCLDVNNVWYVSTVTITSNHFFLLGVGETYLHTTLSGKYADFTKGAISVTHIVAMVLSHTGSNSTCSYNRQNSVCDIDWISCIAFIWYLAQLRDSVFIVSCSDRILLKESKNINWIRIELLQSNPLYFA